MPSLKSSHLAGGMLHPQASLSGEAMLPLQLVDELHVSLLRLRCADTLISDLLPGAALRFLLKDVVRLGSNVKHRCVHWDDCI